MVLEFGLLFGYGYVAMSDIIAGQIWLRSDTIALPLGKGIRRSLTLADYLDKMLRPAINPSREVYQPCLP